MLYIENNVYLNSQKSPANEEYYCRWTTKFKLMTFMVETMTKQPLKTQSLDGETLYLTYIGCGWRLTIEPAYRNNGTQSHDGWFPRRYSKVSAAKAAVTRKFGREWQWQDA